MLMISSASWGSRSGSDYLQVGRAKRAERAAGPSRSHEIAGPAATRGQRRASKISSTSRQEMSGTNQGKNKEGKGGGKRCVQDEAIR